MALTQWVFGLSPCSRCLGKGVTEERRKSAPQSPRRRAFLAHTGTTGIAKRVPPEAGASLGPRDVARRARLKETGAPVVEGGQIGGLVEISVTCYQILGLSEKAEKDEVAKAVMDLKCSEIEDGYTGDIIFSRQHLLMDIRDKLLFEPEYAGNLKEMVPPKSSLRIPWAWLPGALCLLQEAGETKMVLNIGRAALQHPDAKPYVHDVLLSMALAECTIAKAGFEKNKVSEGFEALDRAHYLLKSKASLGSMPLLSQIEESLEELVPACTLEILDMPHNSDNAERRSGALAAFRELLRKGLDGETTSRVQDWHCFLSQGLNKLMAAEIAHLLSWENLATVRKNKKILESQNQRVVIDFDCFYLVMIAHLALGFSTRQMVLISKAKTICECLTASEGVDLKIEEAFCSLLLGQVSEAETFEKLQQLEINGKSSLQSSAADNPKREVKDKRTVTQSLETWLTDSALSLFLDTRDCSPSLANFFGTPKRILNGKLKIGTSAAPSASNKLPSFGLLRDHAACIVQSPIKSTKLMGDVVKQPVPVSLQTQQSANMVTSIGSNSSNSHLKRNLGLQNSNIWQSWNLTGDVMGRIAYTTFVGCCIFGALKMLSMQLGQPRISHMLHSSRSMNKNSVAWTFGNTPGVESNSFRDMNIFNQLRILIGLFRQNCRHPGATVNIQNPWLTDNLSSLTVASAIAGTAMHRRQMPLEEAESLVKQWQDIKAEALGPDYQIHTLPEILSESMLSKWQDLSILAQKRACFWRFVLLKLSILRADILIDELGAEMAEVEAVIEEAAELVDESQPRKPSYYSTYKVQYLLKKQDDGSWRFCGGGIESSI